MANKRVWMLIKFDFEGQDGDTIIGVFSSEEGARDHKNSYISNYIEQPKDGPVREWNIIQATVDKLVPVTKKNYKKIDKEMWKPFGAKK